MKTNLKLAIEKFTVVALTNKSNHGGKTDTQTDGGNGTSSLPCITIDITH